jgi:hypothetical protein
MVYVQYGYTGIYGMFIHGVYTVCSYMVYIRYVYMAIPWEHSAAEITAIQFSIVHTLSGYYILIIARFVRGCAVFERVLARRALGAIL